MYPTMTTYFSVEYQLLQVTLCLVCALRETTVTRPYSCETFTDCAPAIRCASNGVAQDGRRPVR